MSQYGGINSTYYNPVAKFNTLRLAITYSAYVNTNLLNFWCALVLADDTNLFTSIEQEYIARDTREEALFRELIDNNCIHSLANDSNLFTLIEHEYIARDTKVVALFNESITNFCLSNIINDANLPTALAEIIGYGTGGLLYNELLPTVNHCSHALIPDDATTVIPTAPTDDSVDLYQITINAHCIQSVIADANLPTVLDETKNYGTGGLLYNNEVLNTCSHSLATDSNLFTSLEQEYIARDTRVEGLYNELITNSCGVSLSNA